MTASKIEWTQRSDWNPVRGCTRVSPGCMGCYAEAIASRFSGPGLAFEGFATKVRGKPHWTGKVEVMWNRLTDPLKWRNPATIFALSMSDLFHEKLPVGEIASIYAVMVAAVHVRGHTFQVLTKRSARMHEILNLEAFWGQVNAEAGLHVMECTDPLNRKRGDARASLDEYGPDKPPPGIWLGVSVEDQERANERIPVLLATPAVIRFLSCEPLLGPINLRQWMELPAWDGGVAWQPGLISQVIVGGESGPNAHPAHPDWFRSLRWQCTASDTPFFFKQWGSWTPVLDRDKEDPDWRANYSQMYRDPKFKFLNLAGGCGFHGKRLIVMQNVGKKKAGALLDGVEWRQMPK